MPETPPNTPQRARIAFQNLQREARLLESPIRRHCQPHAAVRLFNVPAVPGPSHNHNDPFGPPIAPAVPAMHHYMLPPPPVPNVPLFPSLAAAAAALPPILPPYPLHPAPYVAPPIALPFLLPPAPAAFPPVPPIPLPHMPPLRIPVLPMLPQPPPPPPPIPPAPLPAPNLPVPPAAPIIPPAPAAQRRCNQRQVLFKAACTPFSAQWPVHNLGNMDWECPDCHALHWKSEKLSNSSNIHPKFGSCCLQGKIALPALDHAPPELHALYTTNTPRAKAFQERIRNYNNALAFTSTGKDVDEKINRGFGPYVFKLHGKLTHRAGSLLPVPGERPQYAQLYIYDPTEALEYRMNHRVNVQAGVESQVMQELQDMLFRKHPAAQMYKQALELTKHLPPSEQCRIALHFDEKTDRRRYNAPTDASKEIAVILPGNGQAGYRDIILHRHDTEMQSINECHPYYHSLAYPLLFPTGQIGWHPRIPYTTTDDAIALAPLDNHNMANQNAPSTARKFVSMAEYFRYRIHKRIGHTLHVFYGGKLFQEWLVDCWAVAEQMRLNWVTFNQKKLRADTYRGLTDAIREDPNATGEHIGQRIILPSSFQGSARNMIQNCQDALAINRYFHGADLFITITANPKWPEILAALEQFQDPSNRPDIVVRVFQEKCKQILEDICKHGIMGKAVGRVHTIEFQKRGLPHMHLIVFLAKDDKLTTPEAIDSLLSAEFPDQETEPELFELVKTHMVHTPCENDPSAPCQVNGKCNKNFPKQFQEQTSINEDSYARLRRRDTGTKVKIHRKGKEYEVDNRDVVPYCRYLLWKYRCHINVECIASIKAIKYIYKYVYKGHDRTTMEIEKPIDEVTIYLDSRYVSACEGVWRIMGYSMHAEVPAVYRLQVHLPNEQTVVWDDTVPDLQQTVEAAESKDTTLTGWFKANQEYPEARDSLYQDFPLKFAWDEKKNKWKPRHNPEQTWAIGRMYYAHVTAGERFYLRTLLCVVKGATSFEDLRRVPGEVNACPTFREACIKRGLLEDDSEWKMCLEEAGDMASGRQLRGLFATILRECFPSDPAALWMLFREKICDDLRHHLDVNNLFMNPPPDVVFDYGLYCIDELLQKSGKALADWPAMPQYTHDWQAIVGNRLIREQQNYNVEHEAEQAAERCAKFNPEQRAVFDKISKAVMDRTGQTFFLHGPGGTGKTFVYNTLCHYLRSERKIVLCVASSGIAAILLLGGRTAHSMFKIPLEIHEGSMCGIKRGSPMAELMQQTDLIIWDEAPMQHRFAHEAVDRTLRDIRNCDRPFGGITVVFGGDFKQILPVIVKGSRAEIVGACMQRSQIWQSLEVMKLKKNMRLDTANQQEKEFALWQLQVGEGGHTDQDNILTLPDHFKCPDNTPESLISTIYPLINLPHPDVYYAQRTILASRNADVDEINKGILAKFPGEVITHLSADSIKDNHESAEQGPLMYPVEYLNQIDCSGLPVHKLQLKIGCPVMVLRNLNASEGVCNGSRGILTRGRSRVLEIRLLTGDDAGKTIFVPRISLEPPDSQVPFRFCCRQFPIRLCFAMTINKSQGQSVAHVGLHLANTVFTHGQLYVAISRVTSVHNIKAIWDKDSVRPITKNIVYPEVLIK